MWCYVWEEAEPCTKSIDFVYVCCVYFLVYSLLTILAETSSLFALVSSIKKK